MSETDAYLNAVRAKITAHGWMIQYVFAGIHTPPFQYTVGLFPVAGFEIIVAGLSPDTGATVLNDLAGRVAQHETRFTSGQILSDVLRDYRVSMVKVTHTHGLLTIANRLYRPAGDPVPAWQMVYPDAAHRMPWDRGYANDTQPLLGPAPR
jgi:hypothetical protein